MCKFGERTIKGKGKNNRLSKFSSTGEIIDPHGPSLGQHTKEIFSNLLNLSDVEISQLQKNGVI